LRYFLENKNCKNRQMVVGTTPPLKLSAVGESASKPPRCYSHVLFYCYYTPMLTRFIITRQNFWFFRSFASNSAVFASQGAKIFFLPAQGTI